MECRRGGKKEEKQCISEETRGTLLMPKNMNLFQIALFRYRPYGK